MSTPRAQTHVLIRSSAVQQIRATYPNVSADSLWRVELVNNAYGRGALHLVRVERVTGAPPADAERIVVWRGQVVGLPRCDYCGGEGHSSSTGTAANCSVRAEEVRELRERQSQAMREHWARIKAEAARMREESGPAQVRSQRGTTEPASAGQEPAFFTPANDNGGDAA